MFTNVFLTLRHLTLVKNGCSVGFGNIVQSVNIIPYHILVGTMQQTHTHTTMGNKLIKAIRWNDWDAFCKAVNKESVNKGNDKHTPLTCALHEKRVRMVKYLIEHGANVNLWDKEGCSPLCFAAQHGYIEIVRLLIKRKADINQVDKRTFLRHGRTAVALANNIDVIRVLAEHKADLNIADRHGCTPIWWHAFEGNTGHVRVLAELRANINKADEYDTTPILAAAKEQHTDTVRVLAELKVRP